MAEGKIVMTGGPELALKLESEGYDWILKGQAHG
jgi:Fe-S cluster assembly ATPase SufC